MNDIKIGKIFQIEGWECQPKIDPLCASNFDPLV